MDPSPAVTSAGTTWPQSEAAPILTESSAPSTDSIEVIRAIAPPAIASVPRDPVWSGWDVLLIAGLTILSVITMQILSAAAAHRLFYRHTSFFDALQKPMPAVMGEFLGYIVVVLVMIMLVEGKYHAPFWQAIRWNWPMRNSRVFALGAIGVFTIGLDALGSRFLPMPKTTPFDQFFARPSDAYLIAVFAVTLGPLMEELFFRGLLYPVLARRVGAALGILFTSIPFGLIHYFQYKSWAAVLVITMVGVVLTTVRAMTRSVASSFLVHVSYNGALMVLAGVATDGFRHMDKAALIHF